MLTLVAATYFQNNGKKARTQAEQEQHKMWSMILYLIAVLVLVLAVVLAARCSSKHPFLMGLLAFMFPELYLLYFVVRKYLCQDEAFCPAGLKEYGPGLVPYPPSPGASAAGVRLLSVSRSA